MRLTPFAVASLAAISFAGAANAQMRVGPDVPRPSSPVVAPTVGTTGNDRNVAIAPGPTGASTIQTDSAAASNAAQPARKVPQGSGGR